MLVLDYNRTVVFMISQPCSSIVELFDQFILLAHGKLVYSGEMVRCLECFSKIAHRGHHRGSYR